jgi:hypothetical protein
LRPKLADLRACGVQASSRLVDTPAFGIDVDLEQSAVGDVVALRVGAQAAAGR